MVRIEKVYSNSLASEKGIKEGDILISINDNEIRDVIDYRFYLADNTLSIKVERVGNDLSFII